MSAVTVERDGAVLIATLARPEAMNAVNAEVSAGLGEALATLDADPALRVAIITGTGRAFSAGMDLKAFAAGEEVGAPGHPEWGFAGVVQHVVGKPIIAAVNGLALGGGFEIALAADLIVADEDAAFALPEVSRGLFAAAGGLLRLGSQLPERIATELVLTGRRMPVDEAARYGLVNRVAPAGTSRDAALALARQIADNAPLAVSTSLGLLRFARAVDPLSPEAWSRNSAEMDAVFGSEDAAEGARAFAEKRAPRWVGR